MEVICSWRVHIEKGLVKTVTTSCRVHILRDRRTHALSLGERVEISGSQSLGHQKGLEELTSRLSVLERDSWHSPASSNCCFKAVPLWHLSTPPIQVSREPAIHESVWECIFFILHV